MAAVDEVLRLSEKTTKFPEVIFRHGNKLIHRNYLSRVYFSRYSLATFGIPTTWPAGVILCRWFPKTTELWVLLNIWSVDWEDEQCMQAIEMFTTVHKLTASFQNHTVYFLAIDSCDMALHRTKLNKMFVVKHLVNLKIYLKQLISDVNKI